jgi:hypothetical protein
MDQSGQVDLPYVSSWEQKENECIYIYKTYFMKEFTDFYKNHTCN